MTVASENMQIYFKDLYDYVLKGYQIAKEAKSKGYDPNNECVPLAENMAERVVSLISTKFTELKKVGKEIVGRIGELEQKYGTQDYKVAFIIALELAQGNFCSFKDKKEACEVALRVGLAYLTNGIVASPLEGFTRLEIKKRRDNKGYFCLYFAGPIRSAGTTATCAFVVLADYIRRNMGFDEYDPTEKEIKRMSTEIEDFHEKITNLQYFPSKEEIEFLARTLPLQIDGEPSEKYEVSNYKNLPRVETNILRNGFCLVMAEGLAQKFAKFYGKFSKWKDEFGMKDWSFLEKFIDLQKNIRAKQQKTETKTNSLIKPDYNFIKDLVAGRPILTYPLRRGGFRLRYGRCRISGLSSDAIHPATQIILNKYIATCTQFRTERPGKSSAISVCDLIEGPIVKLKDGTVLFLNTREEAEKYVKYIEEILYLGDILINYGDFLDRAHILVPCGYNEEWYSLELEKTDKSNKLVNKLIDNPYNYISAEDSIHLSKHLGVPLHPRYTYHWTQINKEQFLSLIDLYKKAKTLKNKIELPFNYDINKDVEDKDPKRVLELLGIPHKLSKESILIEGDDAVAFSFCLGNLDKLEGEDVLQIVNNLSGIIIRDKSGTFIGARMGRPEKAKIRKLIGSPQVLFPVGLEGGKMRSFQSALESGKIYAQFPIFFCEKCNIKTIYPVCENCGGFTKKRYYCKVCDKTIEQEKCSNHGVVNFKSQSIDINHYFKIALNKLNLKKVPELIKGVRGTSNEGHIPENLIKGILRAVHTLYVNKDGTIRYDMTEMAITHFKPKEIGTSIKKLNEMGYNKDVYGKDLVDNEQILELKVQDIILPSCKENIEEGADEVLFRVCNFIDDLLVKFYGLEKFYDLKTKKDLIGHLVVAMSPHTSAGNVAKIIGFSKTQGFFAHPLLHSMMRRDADGDEACVILLMDVLLNFSEKYLPSHRGSTQDAPIVLNYKLIPTEVDDMVFNMDVTWKYPLELYEAALQYKLPWEVNIKIYKHLLNTEQQYEGLGFTHDVSDMNMGVNCSAYKKIPTMAEKVRGQMDIAEKIRAVDEADVARLILERHFLRDIKGNLRKFSMQQFRCVKCNEKYRRPPLKGSCLKCKGNIIFTIAEGGIIKYLEPSIELANKYDLPPYIKQQLFLIKNRIESVFGKELEKQEALGKWFI